MNIGRGTVVACAAAGLMTIAPVERVQGQQAAGQTPGVEERAQAPVQPQPGMPQPQAQNEEDDAQGGNNGNGPLAELVRRATSSYRDVQAAESAGYALASGCVSGPEQGAMGVHYVNAALVGDGTIDASKPEALVYEPRNNGLRLVAAEYIVLAEQWDAANEHPPILNGQHFHFVGAPNRSGLPPYYELHVWAWKRNPRGTFADWNPRVSCEDYFVK